MLSEVIEPLQRFLNRAWSRLVDFPMLTTSPVSEPTVSYSAQTLIPQVVYQTWETLQLGRRHYSSRSKFISLNPEFRFEVFDRNCRDAYMQERWGHHVIYDVYTRALFGPMKADIFRYCILFDRGGYYFDISKGLSIPIRELVSPESSELLTVEGNEWPSDLGSLHPNVLNVTEGKLLLQWGFGAIQGHELFGEMIRLISNNYVDFEGRTFDNPKDAILRLTGPIAFTKALESLLEAKPHSRLHVISQPDFWSHGIYSLKGSGARHSTVPSYTSVRNAALFSG